MIARALYYAIKHVERIPAEMRDAHDKRDREDWKAILLTRYMEIARACLVGDMRQFDEHAREADTEARHRILDWLAPPDLFDDEEFR